MIPLTRSQRKHEQLRSRLLGEIAIGSFRPGDPLPGEHQLAQSMQLSRATVRQTLGALERDGIVRRVQGKGTFIADRKIETGALRTSSFAAILPDVATGYYPTFIAEFDRAASEAGKPIIVCNSNNDVDQQAGHLMRLMDQRVSGVVLNPSTRSVTPAYQIRLTQDAGIPVVLLHRSVPDAIAPVLELPTGEIGRRAGRLLVEQGHRRIAYMASHRYVASQAFEHGFREALAESGLDLPEELIDYGNLLSFSADDYHTYEQYLEPVVHRLFTGADRATGVFVPFDATAEILYLIAGRMGLRVPQDFSIVCFGGASRQGAIGRRLSAITVDEVDTAQRAIDLLDQMRAGKLPMQNREVISIALGLSGGSTLGPPP